MTLSLTTTMYQPKRQQPKMPPHSRRRATISDTSSQSQRPSTILNKRPSFFRRRLSLPSLRKVQFSQLSEVCVVELRPKQIWYTGEDHQRFKRERISDVVKFRMQQSSQGAPSADAARTAASASTTAPIYSPINPASQGPLMTVTGPSSSTSSSSCPVGLEQLLSQRGMVDAHTSRKTVIQQVLLEQHRQRLCGFQDPLSIAIVSVRLSADAADGAMKRGKFQEMAKFV